MRLVWAILLLVHGHGPVVAANAATTRKSETIKHKHTWLDKQPTRQLRLRKEDYLKDFRDAAKATVPTSAPTMSPTSSPTLATRGRQFSFQELEEYLVHRGITSRETLNDETTPQSQATLWLAETDPRNVSFPADDADGYHFVTRYVLTTIYFALGGPTTWRSQFNFLTDNDICQWQEFFSSEDDDVFQYGTVCGLNGEIETLSLGSNFLEGSLPSEISRLTTLRALDMDFNAIEGQLPAGMGKLSLLELLALSVNQLGGTLPTSLCDLTSLEGLFLAFNEFTGDLPSCVGNWQSLKQLRLSDNLLSGILPLSFVDLTGLKFIWLDDNILSGDISKTFDQMSQLQGIYLEDNAFQGFISNDFLTNHPQLAQIDISGNDLTGYLPNHIFDISLMPQLELVDVHDNHLSGTLPEVLVTNDSIKLLALHGNDISGEIPLSWTKLRALFHLDLSHNMLGGRLPQYLGDMTELSYLFLGANPWMPGPIPESYTQLTNMEEFSLKDTRRTGELPNWMSLWENLILLDLDQNDFTGEIPGSYGSLTNLQFLFLNRNNLGGEVPSSFSQMINLRAIFLEQNSLMGDLNVLCNLPKFQERVDDDGIEIAAADCVGGGSASVVCPCCGICCAPAFENPVDEGLENEDTCHDFTAIASLNPYWGTQFDRTFYNFGGPSQFLDRDYLVD
uniref:Disease resistance R13L4/SHOC-2-like LRR domain-containing protein n=1 Tax=Amphora coffeiformis TaxID=265554 RepID=A0A7S3P922_9STRA